MIRKNIENVFNGLNFNILFNSDIIDSFKNKEKKKE
jgi:hypothetical protein